MFRVNETVEDDAVKDRKEALDVTWREVLLAGVSALESAAATQKELKAERA